jgi:uncharacterized protein Yka (UPF0111/DUF47 family)
MPLADYFKKIRNIRLLPPRDKEFYDLFNELTSTTVGASELLMRLFDSESSERGEVETRISTAITHCNQVGESIEALLRSAQQPPFDRSEISQFVEDLNRIIKYIGHAANRYVVYDFPSSDKEMRELSPIINEACKAIAKAVESLHRNRNLEPFYKAVDELELKADIIYHEGLRRRFQEIRGDRLELEDKVKALPDPPTPESLLPIIVANTEYTRHTAIFFILRQVYAEMERAIDACSDVTATLKRMVTKNV